MSLSIPFIRLQEGHSAVLLIAHYDFEMRIRAVIGYLDQFETRLNPLIDGNPCIHTIGRGIEKILIKAALLVI